MAQSCHPRCQQAMNEQEDHDASESAAMVAVNLISAARVIFKLDDKYTAYSAQYLVENACSKKEEMDQECCELTVKDCLKYVLKEGIPKEGNWAHLGCVFKPPPFACYIPRVFMKGEVIEPETWGEALKLFLQQPIGARLHVFSPEIDLVGDGIYKGPSCSESRYVGLRDVMIVAVKKVEECNVAEVQICYKKKVSFIKVDWSIMFDLDDDDDDGSGANEALSEPVRVRLLVDWCAPRLTI